MGMNWVIKQLWVFFTCLSNGKACLEENELFIYSRFGFGLFWFSF